MMRRAPFRLLACILPLAACGGGGDPAAEAEGEKHSAFAATGSVARADSGGARAPRIIPLRPMAGDVEILYGNPDSAGPFAMRIREPPGNRIPPHSHPVDEHVTVVQGTWYYAFGERWDSTALHRLETGGYAFAPAGTMMYGWSPDAAVVQVHGTGPFHIHWRDGLQLLDQPGADSVFRHRRGETVATPRGTGRIRQGYASGEIVQYELEGPGGAVFMADQREVRRP